MKRLLVLAVSLALTGCTLFQNGGDNLYENPFYARFLNTGSQLDARITATLTALRENSRSPELHNELGQLLVQKGFPNDAEREFERAINEDGGFYPAWYNLGLVRASQGDFAGARRALYKTTRLKKGHAAALFELGLIEEQRGDTDQAVAYYAKAFRHNPVLLDVRSNPRILDSKLIHLALLANYPRDHARASSSFEGAPPGYVAPQRESPSPQAPAEDIVTPAAPVTDPATQTAPPTPPGG